MTAPLKPPFTYFGGKTSVAERIVALLPPHEHYVEPFAGSLAVLLAKPPSPMETVNEDRTEVLWSNRPFPQGSLFDLEAS